MTLRRSLRIIVDILKARFANSWDITGYRYCFGCVLDIRGAESWSRNDGKGAKHRRDSRRTLQMRNVADLAAGSCSYFAAAPSIARLIQDFRTNRLQSPTHPYLSVPAG